MNESFHVRMFANNVEEGFVIINPLDKWSPFLGNECLVVAKSASKWPFFLLDKNSSLKINYDSFAKVLFDMLLIKAYESTTQFL